MMTQKTLLQESLDRYFRERDRYTKLAERVADIIREEIVEQNAIHAQVTYRAKTVSSLEGKLRRLIDDGRDLSTVDDVFNTVRDLAAVRVLAYREEDIDVVNSQISQVFVGLNGENVVSENIDKSDGVNFYKAKHFNVLLPAYELVGSYENLQGTSCEIQVCSMMAHVWNEIEHDIGYKPKGKPGTDEVALLTALGHLTRSGDKVISQLLSANQTRLANETEAFTSPFDFAARLRSDFSNVDMSRNVSQIFEYLTSRNVTSPSALKEYLGMPILQVPNEDLINDFNHFLDTEYSTSYRLDSKTADVLLILLLQKEANEIASANEKVGRGRPTRIKKLAEAFVEYMVRTQLHDASQR